MTFIKRRLFFILQVILLSGIHLPVLAYSDTTNANKELFTALLNNNLQEVQLSLSHGANVNAADSDGDRPLMYAAVYSSVDIMKLLLKNQALPNEKNKFGETALMMCTKEADKIKILVDAGADINSRSNLGNTPFLIACKGVGQTDIVLWMISKGADEGVVNSIKENCLMRAAPFGDTGLIKILLEKKPDINAVDEFRLSALNYAVLYENWDVASLLLKYLPEDPRSDSILGAALSYAVVEENLEIVREMLKKMKDIDWTDPDGYTTLMWAVYNEHAYPEMVKAILERKPKIGHEAKDGSSAMSWALKKGNTSIVQLLQQAKKKQL